MKYSTTWTPAKIKLWICDESRVGKSNTSPCLRWMDFVFYTSWFLKSNWVLHRTYNTVECNCFFIYTVWQVDLVIEGHSFVGNRSIYWIIWPSNFTSLYICIWIWSLARVITLKLTHQLKTGWSIIHRINKDTSVSQRPQKYLQNS